MATSGSIDFSLTRNKIINAAFRKAGIKAVGETLEAEQVNDAAEDLNMMVKAWNAQAIHLWCYEEVTLFLTQGVAKYLIGSTGDHATASAVNTTLAADAASGASSITVASATGISSGDNIGIVLDDGTINWDTVSGAPVGAVITLTGTLSGAASNGNRIYTYTNKAERPLKVLQARHKDSDGNEIDMKSLSRNEYFGLSNKSAQGISTQYYYEPTLTNGSLYLWTAPDSVSDTIQLSVQRSIQDFDAENNNPDLPQEWYEALVWNLADRLGTEYGLDEATQNRIEKKAAIFLDIALSFDAETASVYMQPGGDFDGATGERA